MNPLADVKLWHRHMSSFARRRRAQHYCNAEVAGHHNLGCSALEAMVRQCSLAAPGTSADVESGLQAQM